MNWDNHLAFKRPAAAIQDPRTARQTVIQNTGCCYEGSLYESRWDDVGPFCDHAWGLVPYSSDKKAGLSLMQF